MMFLQQPYLSLCSREVRCDCGPVFRLVRIIGRLPKSSPYYALERWEVLSFCRLQFTQITVKLFKMIEVGRLVCCCAKHRFRQWRDSLSKEKA